MPSKPLISRLFFFPSSNFVTIASTCSLDSISAHLLKHLVYIECPLSVLNYQYYLSVELFSSAYQHGLVSLIFRIEKKSWRLYLFELAILFTSLWYRQTFVYSLLFQDHKGQAYSLLFGLPCCFDFSRSRWLGRELSPQHWASSSKEHKISLVHNDHISKWPLLNYLLTRPYPKLRNFHYYMVDQSPLSSLDRPVNVCPTTRRETFSCNSFQALSRRLMVWWIERELVQPLTPLPLHFP